MTESKGCLAGLLGLFSKDQKPGNDVDIYPFRVRDDFLSNAEISFYHVLQLAINGEGVICPKVSLAELFFVTDKTEFQRYFNMISRKRTDFLVCDPQTMKPLYGIELDDQSHQNADRIQRDAFVEKLFSEAGLPLLRFPAKATYNLADVKLQLQAGKPNLDLKTAALPDEKNKEQIPLCPKCGVTMIKRVARSGTNAGREFYGCVNYPNCKEIQPIALG